MVKVHPNKKLRAKAGDVFGKLRIVRKMRNPKNVYGITWKVQCSCGSDPFVIREQYLFRKDNPKVDCGCERKTIITDNKREYSIWKMMNRRCYFETHIVYSYYGGAGVTVCDRWLDPSAKIHKLLNEGYYVEMTMAEMYQGTLKSFGNFLKDMGRAPSRKHTLDRINPFGNYEPSNTRWALPEVQANNKRWNYHIRRT